MENFEIRVMTRDEIDLAVEWAANEGWNPGLHDADTFFAADPEGFLIGLVDGNPAAAISVVRYGRAFSFLGFYIVLPEYRGKGYGYEIWKAAVDRVKGYNLGLDGVVEQQENYKKSGFKLAYRNIRYEGKGGATFPDSSGIIELKNIPFETIERYDFTMFAAPRDKFLKQWINPPEGKAFSLVDRGNFSGYGVIRKCRSGYKIGPLFANTPQQAEILFNALRSFAGADDPVFLDTPEVNREAVELAERYGMSVVFETARMYTMEKPDIMLDRLYGVTTFELG